MTQKNVDALLKQWNQVKGEIEELTKLGQASVTDIQKKVDGFVKSAEKDFKNIVDKDLPALVKKFQKEKATLEKTVEKTVNEEIKKAKAYLEGHKKELNKIQKLVESYLPKKKKAAKKKATKKKATKKAASKKATKKKAAAKKTTKKAVAKKTTKKAPAKTTKKAAPKKK